jgi:hypothetical protein
MDFNNDPAVTFADLKRLLRLAEMRIGGSPSAATATVRGRLLQNRSPVAGATVVMYCRDPKVKDRKEMSTVTAKDGTYQFDGVAGLQGWYVYGKMASISERGATIPAVALTFPGETTEVRDLEILPAHSVRGKVTLSDGRPLPEGSRIKVFPGCMIGCVPFDVPDSQEVALPQDGTFVFRGLRGPIGLSVLVKGYGLHVDALNGKPPGQDNFNERTRQTINLVELVVKDTAEVNIALEPRRPAQK